MRSLRGSGLDHGIMTIGGTPLRALVRDMLALVDHEGAYAIGDNISGFSVDIAQSRIDFASGAAFTETALERLASAIEARIAFDRARAMLVAAGSEATHFPLWLISGSAALAKWFVWSRMQNSLRRVLAFSDHVGLSPIYGQFERPTRRAVGQGAAKIRIRGGEAIAERIELPGRHRCTLTIGTQTRVRIEGIRSRKQSSPPCLMIPTVARRAGWPQSSTIPFSRRRICGLGEPLMTARRRYSRLKTISKFLRLSPTPSGPFFRRMQIRLIPGALRRAKLRLSILSLMKDADPSRLDGTEVSQAMRPGPR